MKIKLSLLIIFMKLHGLLPAVSSSFKRQCRLSSHFMLGNLSIHLLTQVILGFVAINFFWVVPFLNPVRAILEEGCSQESFKQQKADRIVIGTVSATNCSEKVCLTTVQVEENLKGTGALKIFIETPGSNVPVSLSESIDFGVEDNPTFTKGESAKFYLKSTTKSDTYTLVCGDSGKELLTEDKPGSETPECQNLWWFDKTQASCQQKKFCGLYMYKGLRTFETIEGCQENLQGQSQSPAEIVYIPSPFQRLTNFFTSVFSYLKRVFSLSKKIPLTWEECIKNPKSKIQATYPSVCVYPDGRTAIEPELLQSENPGIIPEKVFFNNKVYVPAKCFMSASTRVKRIGVSEEGLDIYGAEEGEPPNIPEPGRGILFKRSDGTYQCYAISPNQ